MFLRKRERSQPASEGSLILICKSSFNIGGSFKKHNSAILVSGVQHMTFLKEQNQSAAPPFPKCHFPFCAAVLSFFNYVFWVRPWHEARGGGFFPCWLQSGVKGKGILKATTSGLQDILQSIAQWCLQIHKEQPHCYKTWAEMVYCSAFVSLLRAEAWSLAVHCWCSVSITKQLPTRLKRRIGKNKRKQRGEQGCCTCFFPARCIYSLKIHRTISKMTGVVGN